ncbi:MAG: hypothetical protein AAFW75_13610 [Cyanobacteria bacterium J06636_16]
MSTRPNFVSMALPELRDYILANRHDREALHVYLDKLHAENPEPRTYGPEENVSEAIARYLENKKH